MERTEASAQKVVEFLRDFGAVDVWLDGGWGVDALLGVQSRLHSDLDIIIRDVDLAALTARLQSHGYVRLAAGEDVFKSPSGLSVDIHCVRFDAAGYGIFDLPDGRQWPFPPSAFQGTGLIGDMPVRWLSPEAQVQCHAQGYAPALKDLADMQALQRRFEVVLPLQLCQQPIHDSNA